VFFLRIPIAPSGADGNGPAEPCADRNNSDGGEPDDDLIIGPICVYWCITMLESAAPDPPRKYNGSTVSG
jgi:hypothetical protein